MGCDIHIIVETKWNHSDQWQNEGLELSAWRNYELFAKLANVRNDYNKYIVPIAEARGLPSDVTDVAKEILNNPDYHSHSWISAEEFKANWPFPSNQKEASDWVMLGWYWLIWAGTWMQVRFVFAFDN